MATLDEIRLAQLLQPFKGPSGIASLSQAQSPLSFRYQDQQYLNQDPTQDFYEEVNISPTQNFYPLDRNPTQMFYQPRDFVNAPQSYYQPDLTTLKGLDMNRFQGVSDMSMIDETTDDEQVDYLPGQEPSGIAKLLDYLPFVGEKSLGRAIIDMLPKMSPEAKNMRNFYGSRYGLTDTGQVASGIMKGYNPVSGGFLNFITGGRLGKPTSYGLADAMQRRIENILGRKAAQTDASRAKVAELRNLQRAEMRDRADRGESLSSIGKSTFTGKGQAFERRSGGSSGVKGTSSERNYGGR